MEQEILNPMFYDEKGRLLPEFKKFNWGACIFGFIWGIFNKSYITFLSLLVFVPYRSSLLAGIVIPIWLGLNGNEWAIKNKEWQSIEHFNHIQKLWAIWSAVVSALILIPAIVAYVFLIVWIINNPERAQEIINQLELMAK